MAVDKHEAAGLFDDAVYRRQPEPGSGAQFLRRKKRIENAPDIAAGDPDAGIGYLDQHVVARRHHLVPAPLSLRRVKIHRANGQGPTAGHGVPSIDREVDDDLLELTLVNLDRAKVAPVHNFELDILADQTPQQVRQIDQHIGDIENPWLQCLLPREGQDRKSTRLNSSHLVISYA